LASGLSAATGDVASFVIVASIVTVSITLDFVQEVRAHNAVDALRRSVAVQANVRRQGTACQFRSTNWFPVTLSS
jgi:Mg2+-importing ATPase